MKREISVKSTWLKEGDLQYIIINGKKYYFKQLGGKLIFSKKLSEIIGKVNVVDRLTQDGNKVIISTLSQIPGNAVVIDSFNNVIAAQKRNKSLIIPFSELSNNIFGRLFLKISNSVSVPLRFDMVDKEWNGEYYVEGIEQVLFLMDLNKNLRYIVNPKEKGVNWQESSRRFYEDTGTVIYKPDENYTKYDEYYAKFFANSKNVHVICSYDNVNSDYLVNSSEMLSSRQVELLIESTQQRGNVLGVTHADNGLYFWMRLENASDLINGDVFYENRKGNERILASVAVKEKQDGFVRLFISLQEPKFDKSGRYDLWVDNDDNRYKLQTKDSRYKDVFKNYGRIINFDNLSNLSYRQYLSAKGELSVFVNTSARLKSDPLNLKPILKLFKKSGRKVKVVLDMQKSMKFSPTNLVLEHRSPDEKVFSVSPMKIEYNNARISVSYEFLIDSFEWEPFYFDVLQEFSDGENKYAEFVKVDQKMGKLLRRHIMGVEFKMKDGNTLYPYATGINRFAFTYRKHGNKESFGYALREWVVGKAASIFKPSQEIYLIHEKFSESAQDNSFYFFKYMFENHPEIPVYYVIDKKSPDYNNLKEMRPRVLNFMSLKHLWFIMKAKVIVSSESKAHGYAWRQTKGPIRKAYNKKPYVFLQHGVTAMKKHAGVFDKLGLNSAEIFITTSEFEKQIIVKNFGYDDSDVAVTGFSRWDYLHEVLTEDSFKKSNSIFLMPTWRNWLEEVEDEAFVESEYYKRYSQLLNSEELEELLIKNDKVLNVYIHPKFADYVDNFHAASKRVNIIKFGEAPINQLIAQSDVLITDYSSVAWEALYQGIPSIFYQFDQEQYLKYQGSYMNLDDLFGQVIKDDVQQVIAAIETALKQDENAKLTIENDQNKYFAFNDNHNSERIFAAIENKIGN